jgi:hypothetical protein
MSTVCPQCHGLFDQHLQCPSCGTRPYNQAAARNSNPLLAATGERWQDTALGRVAVGLVVAGGLAYGLRTLCNATVLGTGAGSPQALWTTLPGLLILQGLQGIGLLVGGALAGAGQRRGALLGSMVGLLNGFVAVILQQVNGEAPVTEVVLYGQPILHLAFGAAGGLLGTVVWKPLPPLIVASAPGEARKGGRPAYRSALVAAPVSWPRVLLGVAVVLAGSLWPKVILDFVLDASQGRMAVSSHLQAKLVTWEVSALVMLLGAGLSGVGAFSGLKQGLYVGVGAGLAFAAVQLGAQRMALEQALFTVFLIAGLSAAGGWFGGKVFPPIASFPRRRRGESALSRAQS